MYSTLAAAHGHDCALGFVHEATIDACTNVLGLSRLFAVREKNTCFIPLFLTINYLFNGFAKRSG